MQITKIQSPSFQAIHAQTSKMTNAQRELTSKITDAISYSDAYIKAKNMGIDVCIFPKGTKNIKAKFLDIYSENYIKNKNRTPVTLSTKFDEKKNPDTYSFAAKNNKIYENADKLINKLEEITSGKYKFEDINDEKISNGNTDLNRLLNEFKSYEIDANTNSMDITI